MSYRSDWLKKDIDRMCQEQVKEFEEAEKEKKRLAEEERLREEKLAKTKADLDNMRKEKNPFKNYNPFF